MEQSWGRLARGIVLFSLATGVSLSPARTASAAASDFHAVKCDSGFVLERDGAANRYRCKKTSTDHVFVTCSIGYLHQALDGKDTCKSVTTANAPNQLRCMTLPTWTVPGSGGWTYQVMPGGDRCNKQTVEYSTPHF